MKQIKESKIQTMIPTDYKEKIVRLAKREYEDNESQAVRKLLAVALEDAVIRELVK